MKRHRTKIFLIVTLATVMPLGVLAATLTVTVGTHVRGNMYITGNLTKGSGTFFIDNPLQPYTELLYHSFIESNEMKNMYDGVATLDANGEAVINLPDYFDALNTDVRYQFFPHFQAMPNLYVKQEEKNNSFVIAGGVPGGEISWQVTGNRHDPYAVIHPMVTEVRKTNDTVVKDGDCIFEPLCK